MPDPSENSRPIACARCGSHRLVRGRVDSAGGDVPRFLPAEARASFVQAALGSSGIELPSELNACAACGLVSGTIDRFELSRQLAHRATPAMRRWLDEKPDEPL